MADILLGDLRDIWRDNKDAAEAMETILDNEDFAEQTTLNELKERFDTDGENEVGKLIETLENKVATQAELEAVKSELETIKANQTNGDQKVKQTGRNVLLDSLQVTLDSGDTDESLSFPNGIPDLSNVVYFYLALRADETIAGNVIIRARPRFGELDSNINEPVGSTGTWVELNNRAESTTSIITEYQECPSPFNRFNLDYDLSEETIIDVYLFGVS